MLLMKRPAILAMVSLILLDSEQWARRIIWVTSWAEMSCAYCASSASMAPSLLRILFTLTTQAEFSSRI
ncbi:wsv333 [White spot syndrome virus]|uniref:Wsv333 n=5 Tax=White spot syndrome virus TaxID=342409 RepID=Q8VAR4_WSSVS